MLNHECIKWQVRLIHVSNTHNFAGNCLVTFELQFLYWQNQLSKGQLFDTFSLKLVHQWKSFEFWLDGKTCALHQPDNLDVICWLKTEVKRHQTVVFPQSERWGCGFCPCWPCLPRLGQEEPLRRHASISRLNMGSNLYQMVRLNSILITQLAGNVILW